MDSKEKKTRAFRFLSLFVAAFFCLSLMLISSEVIYAASEEINKNEMIDIRLGEKKEQIVTLNDDDIASRKITATNGEKGNYKLTVETSLPDSYWKGSELELTSGDNSLFQGTFASLTESQSFTLSESSFTASVTPSLEKKAASEYQITYTITQGKNSAIVIIKYHPLRIKGVIYKGVLACSVLLLLVLIVQKGKRCKINHFPLKISMLLLLILMSLFLVLDFGIGYMRDSSMSPDISENDLIISKSVSVDTINKGDIIVLRSSDNLQEIVEKVQKMDATSMKVTTKNEETDSLETESSTQKIQGKVLFTIPKIGRLLSLMKVTIK